MGRPADDGAGAAEGIVADVTSTHAGRPADNGAGAAQSIVADVTSAQTDDTEYPVPLVA